MTTIGPALTRLFGFVGPLPSSDVWEAWDGEERDREGRWLVHGRGRGLDETPQRAPHPPQQGQDRSERQASIHGRAGQENG